MRFRLLNESKNSTSDVTLYHNTPYKNIDSILKNGLLVGSSRSEKASGYQFTWATTHQIKDDSYGGSTIIFTLPKDYAYEQVNNDQYIIYQDIEPSLIQGVDILIGDSETGYMHQSEVQEYTDDYGAEKVKKVILKHHSPQLTNADVMRLTPELGWKINESVNRVKFSLPTDSDIKSGSATFLGMKIKYVPNAHYEAENHGTYMNISDKFFNLSDENKLFILVHEVGHNVSDDIMEKDWQGASKDGLFVTKKRFIQKGSSKENAELADELKSIDDDLSNWQELKIDKNGYRNLMQRRKEIVAKLGEEPREYVEGIFGDIGNALGETLANAVAYYYLSPANFKNEHPQAFKYIDDWMIFNKSKLWSR